MKGLREHALELLELARENLVAGGACLATGQAVGATCFHAQQAAEKALKALLAICDVNYPKVHDLGVLVTLLHPLLPTMDHWAEVLPQLTPFAVAIRYDRSARPQEEEARHLLAASAEFLAWAEEYVASAEGTESLPDQEGGDTP